MNLQRSGINVTGNREFEFPIEFADGLFNTENDTLYQYVKNKKCLVIISNTVKSIYYEEIYSYLLKKIPDSFKIVVIKTKEANKDINNIMHILEQAKRFGLGRTDLFIAVSGGILMDMVGFAASMYRRGIDYLRIPTTLLGQIDAGVGIKTGVNFCGSKNFIGAFYPPIAVLNDPKFLKTLETAEIKNGLAEIIKMAVIVNEDLFNLLENRIFDLLTVNCSAAIFNKVNYLAVEDMINELSTNFYERNLERLVDFGHTFSPFIETFSDYGISHGFAVAMDIAISAEVAYLLNMISLENRNRIHNLLLKARLRIYDKNTFLPYKMYHSLKEIVLHRGGSLNLVVPVCIGKAVFIRDLKTISVELLDNAFTNIRDYQINKNEEWKLII